VSKLLLEHVCCCEFVSHTIRKDLRCCTRKRYVCYSWAYLSVFAGLTGQRYPVSAYFVPIREAADSALLQTYVSASESTQTVDLFNCDVVIHALEYAWLHYGQAVHYKAMARYVLYLLLFSVSNVVTFYDENNNMCLIYAAHVPAIAQTSFYAANMTAHSAHGDMNESASYIVHDVFPDQQSHTQLLMFGGLVYTHTYTAYYDYYITHRCLLPTLMQACVLALALFYIHEEVVQYLMEVKMESSRVSTSIASVHTSPSQASADTHTTTQPQSTSLPGNHPASTSTHADTQATATEHSTEKPPSMISLYADVAVDHLMDIWNILDVIAFFGTVAGYTGLVRKLDALLPVITLAIPANCLSVFYYAQLLHCKD
jgi:hypothetical protein